MKPIWKLALLTGVAVLAARFSPSGGGTGSASSSGTGGRQSEGGAPRRPSASGGTPVSSVAEAQDAVVVAIDKGRIGGAARPSGGRSDADLFTFEEIQGQFARLRNASLEDLARVANEIRGEYDERDRFEAAEQGLQELLRDPEFARYRDSPIAALPDRLGARVKDYIDSHRDVLQRGVLAAGMEALSLLGDSGAQRIVEPIMPEADYHAEATPRREPTYTFRDEGDMRYAEPDGDPDGTFRQTLDDFLLGTAEHEPVRVDTADRGEYTGSDFPQSEIPYVPGNAPTSTPPRTRPDDEDD
jgi:hypothetical protein